MTHDATPAKVRLTDGLGRPNAQDVERLRFEAWMDGLQFNLRRHADRPHQYANTSVQGRWVAWQAAANDMREQLRPLTFCGCGDGFTAHDPGTCGACVAGLTCAPG